MTDSLTARSSQARACCGRNDRIREASREAAVFCLEQRSTGILSRLSNLAPDLETHSLNLRSAHHKTLVIPHFLSYDTLGEVPFDGILPIQKPFESPYNSQSIQPLLHSSFPPIPSPARESLAPLLDALHEFPDILGADDAPAVTERFEKGFQFVPVRVHQPDAALKRKERKT